MSKRAHTSRCLQILGDTQILIKLQDGNIQRFRSSYFHIFRENPGPYTIWNMAHLSIPIRLKVTPKEIKLEAQQPATTSHYHKYPDAKEWKVSHKAAFRKI